jgi:prepilin-type N-terminal cleavage/methylation domain-containing protein
MLADGSGFSLLELLVVAGLISVLGAVALGVSNTVVRMMRAESGAQQLDAFLKRYRETAVSRRRDIEIRFIAPNQVSSLERAVPNNAGVMAAPTPLETIVFENGLRYQLATGVPDTPNLFGNAAAISLGGANPVMFSSEGAFIDANNNPINATLFLAVPGDRESAAAVTILGPTATIERWRWNGGAWTK